MLKNIVETTLLFFKDFVRPPDCPRPDHPCKTAHYYYNLGKDGGSYKGGHMLVFKHQYSTPT